MYMLMILKFLYYAELAIDHTITRPDSAIIRLFFHARYTAALDRG
jgi:hypothetical protein